MKSYLNDRQNSGLRRASGFTLIELLVATSITALLITLMITIVINVTGSWSRASGVLSTGAQARLILDQVGRDLQGAILKRDGNTWLAATIQQNQATTKGDSGISDAAWPATGKPAITTSPNPGDLKASFLVPAVVPPSTTPDLLSYRFGQAGTWLRFFTGVPDTNTGGISHTSAPRAVSYQIVRMPIITQSKEVRYLLFRSEVRPGDTAGSGTATRSTFGQGYDLFAANGYSNPDDGINIGTDSAEPGTIRRPTRSLIIGTNVVDFGVRFWTRDATGALVIKFPVSTTNIGFAATTKDSTSSTPAVPPVAPLIPVAQMTWGFPEIAEVFVRILTDEGVKQVELYETRPTGYKVPTGATWWSIVESNSKVYTSRIEIKGTSL